MVSMAGRPTGRIAIGAFVLLWFIFAFTFLGGQREWYHDSVTKIEQHLNSWSTNPPWSAGSDAAENKTDPVAEFLAPANASIGGLEESLQDDPKKQEQEQEPEHKEEEKPESKLPISYQLDVPAKVGCEDLVHSLQLRLISEYRKLLKGVRYANIWGYLETENKGDAAIWAAQQILFSMMGIKLENACRFMNKGCDLERFNATLRKHKPYSAIVMAGGGNFNDHYWEDQPSRIEMIDNYHDIPVRAFPQSIHMTKDNRIQATKDSFSRHPNLQVAARDQPSYDWLNDNLGQQALGGKEGPKNVLVPDIAFMWGNRPDFRTETKKTHDIVILARDDAEISAGKGADTIPFGTGVLDLGGKIGNVTYYKVDWKFTHTPGIDKELPKYLVGKLQGVEQDEKSAQKSGESPKSQDSEASMQQEHTEQHTEQHDNSDQNHDGKPPAEDEHPQNDAQRQEEPPKEDKKEGESHMEEYHKEGESNDDKPKEEQSSADHQDNSGDPTKDDHNDEHKEDGGSDSESHDSNNDSNDNNEHKDKDKRSHLAERGFKTPTIPEFVEDAELGRNQRAWAKAIAGFELLGSGRFVITDRLHGHIMSTIIGVPHVLMDSKLGKNLNFHDTWTQECECTKVTTDFEKSLEVARLYFESEMSV